MQNNNTNNSGRLDSQNLKPSAIHQFHLSSTIISATNNQTLGPASVPNGSSLIIQSIIAPSSNRAVRIGGVPYNIVFFQTSLNTTNIIGASITGSGYAIKGPFSMPAFTPIATNSPTVRGGSNGNNLVFITELYNNTGSTQTIYAITNTRYLLGTGGGFKSS